jgi:decaprenylphospho-beta-D-erythro-pentofuranosid-2-ulose 2-reductase
MRKVLIIGATPAIAEAVAREYTRVGASLFLLGRRPERIRAIVEDLRVRSAAQVEYASARRTSF